jgi:hypothetical protein
MLLIYNFLKRLPISRVAINLYPPMMWVKNDPFKKYLNLAILVFVAKFGKYLDRAIKNNSFWIPLKYLKQDTF